MNPKIFVGNLSWSATEDSMKELFAQYGEIISVRIVTDPYTGRSKGFGFVEMADEAACNQAIEKLDNYNFVNRPIRVSRARQENRDGPRTNSRPPRRDADSYATTASPRQASCDSCDFEDDQ